MKRHPLLAVAGLMALNAGTLPAPATFSAGASSFPNDETAIVHVLNRVAFGPRPDDVERVRRIGLQRYIDEQLHPDRVDDRGAAGRLASLPTLRLSSRQIARQFEQPLLDARRQKKADNANAAGNNDDSNADPEWKAAAKRANTVVAELADAKVLRAVYSKRQLQEVLTDFWFNHFNVDERKGADRFMLTEYEREAIRPHVLGRFRDLLEATAKSPAMLFYLDNWMSADPSGPHPQMLPPRVVREPFGGLAMVPRPLRVPAQEKNAPSLRQAQGRGANGLNENYGRELMELHTLGVDGGYTQKDVTEVARCFTGWTIEKPREGGSFKFEPRLHDEGQKVVLGRLIRPGGGERDGEQVLDILARYPSTARFIATKLVRRFVSDTPPPALVDRAAARFRETDGDLREVMRTILTSPEFLAPDAYRAKAKTPLEFVVSAVRASGADVQDAMPLVRAIQQLGMPLYQCQPPTGYKDAAEVWVNSGALVGRMNFAMMLAGGKLPGVSISTAEEPGRLALNLGGPQFQRR